MTMAKQRKNTHTNAATSSSKAVVFRTRNKHLSEHITTMNNGNIDGTTCNRKNDGTPVIMSINNMNEISSDTDTDIDTDVDSTTLEDTSSSNSTHSSTLLPPPSPSPSPLSPLKLQPMVDDPKQQIVVHHRRRTNTAATVTSSTRSLVGTGYESIDEDEDQEEVDNTEDESLGMANLRLDFIAVRGEDENEHDALCDSASYGSSSSSDLDDIKGAESIEVREAIEAIRKEASQIDAIMAVDQLKTLRLELETVTKQFEERSSEAEDLKQKLEQSEDRIGFLELERDLYQADATKLKQDLKTCVDNMFDLTLVEQAAALQKEEEQENHNRSSGSADNENQKPFKDTERVTHPSKSSNPSSLPLGEMRILGLAESGSANEEEVHHTIHSKQIPALNTVERRVVRRSPTLSDPDLLHIQYTTQTSDLTEDDSVFPLLADYERGRGSWQVGSNKQDVFRKRTPIERHKKDSSKQNNPHAKSRRSRSLSTSRGGMQRKLICRDTRQDDDAGEYQKGKMCGIGLLRPLCRSSKRSASNARNADIAMLKKQISNLHEMMRTSLDASEKLRGRIATISRYYEGVIGKLQEDLVECKVSKNRMEVELRSQLSQADLDRKMSLTQKDEAIRRKNEEISILKNQKAIGGRPIDEGEV